LIVDQLLAILFTKRNIQGQSSQIIIISTAYSNSYGVILVLFLNKMNLIGFTDYDPNGVRS